MENDIPKTLPFEEYLEEHCTVKPFIELVYSQLKLNEKSREDSIDQIFKGIGFTNNDGLFLIGFDESVKSYLQVDIDSLFNVGHLQFCPDDIVDTMTVLLSIHKVEHNNQTRRSLSDIQISYFYPIH